ncbi:MAG: hypothetical protein ABIA93_04755 [Candidatus Woesearchaeota archaeon]
MRQELTLTTEMADVRIVHDLLVNIKKTFSRSEANKVLNLIATLEGNPKKGKLVGNVGGLLINELKYKKFRFYFIVEGHKLKVFSEEELVNLLIMVVRMSDKKEQKKTIDEIREVLRKIGPEGL